MPPSRIRSRVKHSCQQCRKRKLGCNRKRPACTSCTKRGEGAACAYDDIHEEAEEDSGVDQPPRHIARSESTKKKSATSIYDQTQLLRQAVQEDEELSEDGDEDAIEASTEPRILGFGFETQFYGPTHSSGIASYFDNLQKSLTDLANEHPVIGSRDWPKQPFQRLDVVYKPKLVPLTSVDAVLSLLPSDNHCRKLMGVFFKHFEPLYSIVHAPNLWFDYTSLRQHRLALKDSVTIAALLLAAMACAVCLIPSAFQEDSKQLYDRDASINRLQAYQWIELAQSLAEDQSHKHATVYSFQIQCLVMLAKQVTGLKVKRAYSASQLLLANALTSGLHRSPEGLSRSFYEKEMRKRLWHAVSEIELAESTERGLPSLASRISSDVEIPKALQDIYYDPSASTEPDSSGSVRSSPDTFASQAYIIRQLRYKVSSLMNTTKKRKALTTEKLNVLHEAITTTLSNVATSSLSAAEHDDKKKAAHEFQTIICTIRLLDSLMQLHFPFAISSAHSPTVRHHSRSICTNSAIGLIKAWTRMCKIGYSPLCIARDALFRGGLMLCLMGSNIPPDDLIYTTNECREPLKYIEQALDIFEERFVALGQGCRGLWTIFAAGCALQQFRESSPALLANWKSRMSNRIVSLCTNVSLNQVNQHLPENSPDSVLALYMFHIRKAHVTAGFNASGQQVEGGVSSNDFCFFDDLTFNLDEWSNGFDDDFLEGLQ